VSFDDLDLERLRARSGKKWSTFAEPVLPAFVADMDFAPAPPIAGAIARALELGDFGYPDDGGARALAETFARRAAARYGWNVHPARIEVVTDVVQAIYIALEVLSEPGEGAVVQTPIYPPFLSAVADTGRRAVLNPLVAADEGYVMDLERLRASLTRDTRIVLLCNPHNPTGRVFRRRELEALAEIVLAHELVVVADELHGDLVYPGARYLPFATLGPEVEARTVTLTSASKAFNIAGLRCALAIFGSERLQRSFARVPRHVRGGLGTLGLLATRTAWEAGDEWLSQVLRYLHGNRDRVAEFVRSRLPGIRHHPPEATYLAWLDCNELGLEPDPWRFLLDRARVALSDGATFGEAGRGFVRLNFATPRPLLSAILKRLEQALLGV